jgi:hypothetical protein
MNTLVTRRALLLRLSLAASAAGVVGTPIRHASGAGTTAPTRLDEHDPAAVALGYVEESSRVDAQKNPTFVAGSNCENCLLLQGKPGESWRPCTLFPGKLVHISGWCKSWAAEM